MPFICSIFFISVYSDES